MPGLRSGKLRLESRLEANLAARLGKHELALRRCLTRPQSGDAKKSAAATAAEKAPRKTPRRKGSNWIDDFDLKKVCRCGSWPRLAAPVETIRQPSCGLAAAQPRLHWEHRANGARRSSRCLSPRPQLRDSTKPILLTNTAAAGSGPHGKAAFTASLTANGCALPTVKAGACSQLAAQQGGIGECSNTKPSGGETRGSSRSAACCGASPVASASGSENRSDAAPDSHHSTTASAATRPKPDISTWQRLGHFYLALAAGTSVSDHLVRGIHPHSTSTVWRQHRLLEL